MSAASVELSPLDPPPLRGHRAGALRPVGAIARRTFRDARVRTIAFASAFALYAYIQPVGYRNAYPTLADRLDFLRSFARNDAIRLFYGYPFDASSVSGYCAWRVGGTLSIVAAVFGVLAAVRALRAEEDAGRMELILAGAVRREGAYAGAMAAIAAGTAILWLAELVGFVVGGLPLGGSAYLALATASVVPVFAGVGALTSQLAPRRRVAVELGSAVIGLSLLLRVIADTSSGAGWLRWATPLGWAEELRPFAGPQPLVLVLPLLASAVLLTLAAWIARSRDVGTALLAAHDSSPPRLYLLSSTTAQALRAERGSLAVWAGSIGVFAVVLGMVSASVSSAGISKNIQREIARLGSGAITSPGGYLAFVFIFFILAVSLFACAQVGAAREEEAGERLETLFALPVSRVRWLAGRLLLATVAAAALSLLAGVLTWAGAAAQGVKISLPQLLEAGANCMPVGLLFLGIAALAYALVPRASAGIAYGLVTVAFLWYLVGALLGVPKWLVEVTPFAQVGLVPAQHFKLLAAAIMLALAGVACAGSLWAFARRDLAGD